MAAASRVPVSRNVRREGGLRSRSCALNGDAGPSSWQHVRGSWSPSNAMQDDVSCVLASSAPSDVPGKCAVASAAVFHRSDVP